MRRRSCLLLVVLAVGDHALGQDPDITTKVSRPAAITINPTPFAPGARVSAHAVVYEMPQPCSEFNGLGSCGTNPDGSPFPCTYGQALELRFYRITPETDSVAQEPNWDSPSLGTPAVVPLEDPLPAYRSRIERDFDPFVVPTSAGRDLFMILYRVCELPRSPEKGGIGRQGKRLGSARFRLECGRKQGVKKAECAYTLN